MAERVTAWRTAAGLTKTQLAGAVGVTAGAVTYWETGENQPTHANVEAISAACGVSLPIFYGHLPAAAKESEPAKPVDGAS